VGVGATCDGKKKEVWEYQVEGPIELWGIQMAIDAVVMKSSGSLKNEAQGLAPYFYPLPKY